MDYGIVRFQDHLNVGAARLVNLNPRIIEIHGEDFSTAQRVDVNGETCPRMEVISRGAILAELPVGVGDSVYDISVVSSGPTQTTSTTSVSLGALTRPATVSGISALVQRVLKVLLTTPGTDVIGGGDGGGILSLIGSLSPDRGTAAADISNSVKRVAEYMFSDPSVRSLPRSEQLGELNLLSVDWDRTSQRVSIQLEIMNVLGEKSVSQLGV